MGSQTRRAFFSSSSPVKGPSSEDAGKAAVNPLHKPKKCPGANSGRRAGEIWKKNIIRGAEGKDKWMLMTITRTHCNGHHLLVIFTVTCLKLRLRDEIHNLPCSFKCWNDAATDLIHLHAYTECYFQD